MIKDRIKSEDGGIMIAIVVLLLLVSAISLTMTHISAETGVMGTIKKETTDKYISDAGSEWFIYHAQKNIEERRIDILCEKGGGCTPLADTAVFDGEEVLGGTTYEQDFNEGKFKISDIALYGRDYVTKLPPINGKPILVTRTTNIPYNGKFFIEWKVDAGQGRPLTSKIGIFFTIVKDKQAGCSTINANGDQLCKAKISIF